MARARVQYDKYRCQICLIVQNLLAHMLMGFAQYTDQVPDITIVPV
jgi:hypothetical protein